MIRKTLLSVALVMGLILSANMARADLKLMKGKFDVTFYGYLKAETIYHSAQGSGDNFCIYAYPDSPPYNHQDTLSFTVRQSRFGFKIAAPGPTKDSKVLGLLEMDFVGNGQVENELALTLRRAFINLKYPKWSLLAGQERMLVSPLYPHVSNYPPGAGLGNLGYYMPQIRITYGNKFRVAMSVGEKIEGDLTATDFDAGDNSVFPDTQFSLGYFGKKFVVALSGHYAEEKHDEGPDLDGQFHDKIFESWSYNLSVNIPLGKKLALAGEYFYGRNLDGWYAGSVFAQGVGYDVYNKRVPVRDVGGWIELMVKPIDRVTIYLGYGIDDPHDEDLGGGSIDKDTLPDLLTPGPITRNQMYYTHIFYDITKAMKVSLEVMQIQTEYHNLDYNGADIHGDDGQLWRADLAFWLFF